MSATPEPIALDEHLRHLADCRDPAWIGETAANALAEIACWRKTLGGYVDRISVLTAELSVARSQLAEAQRDTERLDWLEDRIVDAAGRKLYLVDENGGDYATVEIGGASEFRRLLDAARSTPERGIGPNNVPIMDALKNALSGTPERGDPEGTNGNV